MKVDWRVWGVVLLAVGAWCGGCATPADPSATAFRHVPAAEPDLGFLSMTSALQVEAPQEEAEPAATGEGGGEESGKKTFEYENFNRQGAFATFITLAGLIPVMAAFDSTQQETIGDVFQWWLPLTAFSYSVYREDKEGSIQFLKSLGAELITVTALKAIARKYRPNAASNKSFPSGHAAASFTGAAFINTRYGPRYGVPAFAAATYTAYSRVQAEKHFADDVLSGASIALIYNWLFVSPAYEHDEKTWDDMNWRYEWEFGPTYQDNNVAQSPRGTGTPIAVNKFNETSNPTTNAHGLIEWRKPKKGHEIAFRWAPLEVRDFGQFPTSTNFNNVTFPSATDTRSLYLMFDYRARYRYDFFQKSPFRLKAGASAAIQDTEVGFANNTQQTSVSTVSFLPGVHLHAGYDFNRHIGVFVEGDYNAFTDIQYAELAAKVMWRVNERWDIGLGYRGWDRELKEDKLFNDTRVNRAVLSIGYWF